MSSLVQQSIFENIKHVDSDGNEFWYARELMPLLGYKKWERFSSVIEVAKENLETVVTQVSEHVSLYWEASGRARRENYRLSRLASYHVALSCDSRGNEQVKSAKHYFVVKAREAEVVIPAQDAELEKLKVQLEIARMNARANEAGLASRQLDNTMLTLHGAPTVLALRGMADQVVEVEKPTIEVIDEKSGAQFKGMTLAKLNEFCSKKHGVKHKSGAEIARFLEQKGYGHLIGQIPRRQLTDYVPEENIDEVIKILISDHKQLLLGELGNV